eukprot:754792-Hanusia_phi.AAC.2
MEEGQRCMTGRASAGGSSTGNLGTHRGEELFVSYRVRQERSLDVEPDPLGRLVGHLDPVLQDRDGEHAGGVASQPKAEVLVRRLRFELLADSLQRHHPAPVHVAVLQHHPRAVLVSILHVLGGDGPLALPQGDALDGLPEALLVRELEERGVGVGACRQDKDEGGTRIRVFVAGGEVEGRRLYELLAHLVGDKEHDGGDDLVRSDAPDDEEASEGIAILEVAGEVELVGLGGLEDFLPLLPVLDEVVLEG